MGRARIDEIVTLLHATAPSTLEAMRNRYPEIAEELKLGLTLGGTKEKSDSRRLHARVEVAREAMDVALELASKSLKIAVGRLGKGSVWETAGQAVAIIAAAVTTASAALVPEKKWTIVTASVSLAGSLTTLVAQHQKAGVGGSKDGILNAYAKLAGLVPDVGSTRGDLRVAERGSDITSRSDEIEKMLSRANDLSREVYVCAAAIPGALSL